MTKLSMLVTLEKQYNFYGQNKTFMYNFGPVNCPRETYKGEIVTNDPCVPGCASKGKGE